MAVRNYTVMSKSGLPYRHEEIWVSPTKRAGLVVRIHSGKDLDHLSGVVPNVVVVCGNTPRVTVLSAPILNGNIVVRSYEKKSI